MNRPVFCRFSELQPPHINRDFQVHTKATDGQAGIDELIRRAEELELGEIAFTEHVRHDSTYFPSFADQVRLARKSTRVAVFVGIEAKVKDAEGSLDASPQVLDLCEIVLGSVHRFPQPGSRLATASEFSYEEAAEREFRLAMAMLLKAPITVLAHPGGMCQRRFGKFPEPYFEEMMETALKRGIAIEINTSYNRDLDGFLKLCRKIDPFISIGSDVHKLSDLGTCRSEMLKRGVGCVST